MTLSFQDQDNPAVDFSAKIKRAIVELHGYSYFHNPSEINNVDERFFGRTKIASRLKTLLTSHETKSGSYLITGYRGAGKSSLVAKVLTDISPGRGRSGRTSRYFRILVPLMALAFTFPVVTRPLFLPFAIIALCSLFYLLYTDPIRDDLQLARSGSPKTNHEAPRSHIHAAFKAVRCLLPVSPALGRSFIMEAGRSPELRFRALVQDIYLVSLLEVLGLAAILLFHLNILSQRLWLYLGFFLALLALTAMFYEYRRARRRATAPVTPLAAIWTRGMESIRNYINYSHRVYVKINLGQDDLREAEILRLIAKSVLTKYRAFTRLSTAYMIWRLISFVILFLVVGAVYFYEPIYRLNSGLKRESQLYRYFPTQGAFMLRRGTADLDRILASSLGRKEPQAPHSVVAFDLAQFAEAYNASIAPAYAGAALVVHFPPDRIGTLRAVATHLCSYIDLFLHVAYTKIRDNFPILSELRKTALNHVGNSVVYRLNDSFEILPEQIDYVFCLYLFLVWLLGRFFLRWSNSGFITHQIVLRRLVELNDAIDAQVTKEQSASMGFTRSLLALGLSGRHLKAYSIVSVREIERRLLDIFEDVDRIPRFTVRPNFIFIFDELDKIEPHKNVAIFEKEEEQPTPSTPATADQAFSSYEATRERQHRILGLLSNLKHFFTTARAKFIFIAGREMFDASLADVSDRHFFMGSIFNDVIYVPSFLRDPSDFKLADITSMTEFYVCRFLLPGSVQDKDVSLHRYNKYLRSDFFDDQREGLTSLQRELLRRRREKLVFDLSAFIVFLTYRSSGAPKKITRLFEEHIRRVGKDELLGHDAIVVGKSSSSLYLELTFYDQYTCGLVMYLANPIFLSLNKAIKDFGDKLLVSTSFLLDHIYKFHRFGFSWRNLELIPEIVDINKASQLRELIWNIIHFLESAHIDEIATGFYDFRFRVQISEEIAFLSKISEREAAAFNFTLDESLSLKRHYNRKLGELIAAYGSYEKAQAATYIHSIGFVRMIVGDLHFYDEEYDQAIIEYMEAVQSLQALPPGDLNIRRLLVLVRNVLKLGFAFEKKKTFDSALAAYGRLTSEIVRFRDIDLSVLGLEEKDGRPMRQGTDSQVGAGTGLSPVEFPGLLSEQPFDPGRGEVVSKIAAFAGIRLLYQPFLAKLQVIEKVSQGGITRVDIRTAEEEGGYLIRPLTRDDRSLLSAEFKSKMGDILYFKNGPVPAGLLEGKPLTQDEEIHCLQKGALCSPNHNIKKLADRGYQAPCRGCRCYMESLALLAESGLRIQFQQGDSLLARLLGALDRPILGRRAAVMKEFGRCLAAAGDAFLSCASAADEAIGEEFIRLLVSFLSSEDGCDRVGKLQAFLGARSLMKTEEAILYYFLAAGFYRLAGDHKSYSFQLTKILFVIREHLAITKRSLSKDIIDSLREQLAWRAIRGVYRTYESTHRLEIETFQEIFEALPGSRHHTENVRLNNVSLSFEVREIVILIKEIEIHSLPAMVETWPDGVADPYLFVSPYSLINSIYNRVHELRFRGIANNRIFSQLGFETMEATNDMDHSEGSDRPDGKDWFRGMLVNARSNCKGLFGIGDQERAPEIVLEFLITDSLFCFHEIIRSLRIYGTSYMASHSMLAAAHEKLASWCRRYYQYISHCEPDARARIERKLVDLIGRADLISVAPKYHEELSVVHFRSALEVHSEGRAYRELLEKMYYLNDDFSDKLSHFCAGLERYRINSGTVEKRIEILMKSLKKTRVYDQDRYYAPKREVRPGEAGRGSPRAVP